MTIDNFIDQSLVPGEWRPYLGDNLVKRLLTGDITSHGSNYDDSIAYDYLLAEMAKARETMSEDAEMVIVPRLEDGLDEKVVEGIEQLRGLKNEIHGLEVIGMVAGMVYHVHKEYGEFQKGGEFGIYHTMMTSMRDRICKKGLAYFQKLEDLKKAGIVQKKGVLGVVGEIFSWLPHDRKYNGGRRENPDLSDVYFWAMRAQNSYWSIKGSEKQIKPMEYFDLFTPSIYDHVKLRHAEPLSEIFGFLEK